MPSMRSPSRFAGAERLARFRPDRFTLFLAALAIAGAGLVLAREAAWGVSLSWDSVQYVAAARNLLGDAPLEFVQVGGEHRDEDAYRLWPPFYPMLLAAGGLGAADPLDVAGPLNAIAFGLTVFVAGTWLRRNVRSRFLLLWGCLALTLAPPLAGSASWAMSEAPFVLFATLALTRADAFLREGGGRPLLVQAAAFTAIACLTRYMGVAVFGTVLLLILLHRGPAPAERLRAAVMYALLSLVPLAIWLARNVLVIGGPTDNALPVDYALPEILSDLLIAVGKWAVPLDASWWGRAAAVLLAVALAAGAMDARNGKALAAMRLNPVFGWFVPIFIILHVFAMLSGNTWHGVDERHLLPVYVPLLLVALSALDQILARETGKGYSLIPASRSKRGYGSVALLVIAVSFWMISGATANLQDIRDRNTSPGAAANYASGYWRDSGILEYIAPDPAHGIYSNYPAALYIHLPGFREYGELKGQLSTGYHDNLTRFIAEIADGGDWIVWFHSPVHSRFNYAAADLRAHPGLRLVAEADDGALFRVRRDGGRNAAP